LHRIENEDVVEAALATNPATFHVVEALPWWRNAPRPEAEVVNTDFGDTREILKTLKNVED